MRTEVGKLASGAHTSEGLHSNFVFVWENQGLFSGYYLKSMFYQCCAHQDQSTVKHHCGVPSRSRNFGSRFTITGLPVRMGYLVGSTIKASTSLPSSIAMVSLDRLRRMNVHCFFANRRYKINIRISFRKFVAFKVETAEVT